MNTQPAAKRGLMGDCGNAECRWRGPISECSWLGAVGPCCPICREIVEPDAAKRGPKPLHGENMQAFHFRMTQAQREKLDRLGGAKWIRSQIIKAKDAQEREREQQNAWADLWYFVMDEAPLEFERIVTTYAPKEWHTEAHKLMRAKYPYRSPSPSTPQEQE